MNIPIPENRNGKPPFSAKYEDWVVLIVDDEPDNLGVVEKVLSFNGATTHVAKNGVEGLEILERVMPTFILLDLSMPEMDGWEMLRQVRANPSTAHLPVIALTAHAMPEDVERAKQAGFDGYVIKPIRINSFLLEIPDILAKKSSTSLEAKGM